MAFSYTKEQEEAIYSSGRNILVAAAAGSGKTAVLTERIIQKIINKENPQDISSFLIVTFTSAATAEMRQRIRKKLEEAYEIAEKEKDKKLLEHISNQLSILNKANISTIDSFCLDIVRKNFNILGIDPSFKIVEATETEILKEEILNDILEEFYEKNDESFVNFINFFSDNYSKNTDKSVKEFIFAVYNTMQNMPNPLNWLNESIENFNLSNMEEFLNTKWAEILKNNALDSLDDIKELNKSILDILYSNTGVSDETFEIFLDIETYLNWFKKILTEDFSNCYVKITENNFKMAQFNKKSFKNILYDEDIEYIANTKGKISKSISNLKNSLSFFSEKSFKMTVAIYPIMITLKEILIIFSERFFNAKKEKFILGFNDIIHLALKVLLNDDNTPTSVAKELRDKFVEVIVDEYQDITEVQEALLYAVSKDENETSNRFMVGDIKQCIYGFRDANPNLFAEKYDLYTTDKNNTKSGYRINLAQNFRSRKEIIDITNFVFKQIMTKEFSNIEYDEKAELRLGANYPSPENINISNSISNSVEFEIINCDEDDELIDYSEDDNLQDLKKLELEIIAIVNKIKYFIEEEKLHIFDKDTQKYRLVQYKDITILSSARTIFTEIQNIFLQKKIPFSLKTKENFFVNLEIATILAFLSIIDNPYQEIELFTVLHSPVYNFTLNELTEIKLAFPNMPFFDAMTYYITPENKEINQSIFDKINIFLANFEKWKEYSLDHSINELLQTIYDDTDYYNYVGILPNGVLKRTNLKLLQEKAIAFENSNEKGLFKFIKYAEKIKKSDNTEEEEIFYENDNVVNITTIHQSKGLEYPVLFVCHINKHFTFENSKPAVDKLLGIGTKFKDIEHSIKFNNISRTAILAKSADEIIAERIRLLYVALTRAREKLVLVGSLNNFDTNMTKLVESAAKQPEKFSNAFIRNTKSFFDLLISAFSRHKDCQILRNFSNTQFSYDKINSLMSDKSSIKINIYDKKQLNTLEKVNLERKKELLNNLENLDKNTDYSNYKQEIEKRLNWTYPNCDIQHIPLTTSISTIKRKAYEIEEYIPTTLPTPSFVKDYKGLTAAQKGTAVHTLMENLNLKETYNEESLTSLINTLVKMNILTKEEANSIDISKILAFLSSEIAEEIKNSIAIHKETPFVMGLLPKDVLGAEYENIKYNESKILVHGIIDLYFETKDGIILIDYKTDSIKNNNIDEIKDKYKLQIDMYKKAIELGTGKKVIESGLYLFNADTYSKY